MREFSANTRARYQASQQLVPTDIDRQLTSLEFPVEGISQAMEEKQREQKRAKTTRSDYLSDVEQVQSWIRQAELKIQNRSIEPAKLMEQLRQIQSELAPMSDKLERLTRNGQIIMENTRDESEKELIGGTIANLTEQMGQVKSWLDEKKQLIGDVLDAWQRFLALHEAVKSWIEEKRVFLVEPLRLSCLNQARQRLHDYSVGLLNLLPLSPVPTFSDFTFTFTFYSSSYCYIFHSYSSFPPLPAPTLLLLIPLNFYSCFSYMLPFPLLLLQLFSC